MKSSSKHHRPEAPRRGNSIVLVVGILVLLVIIATGYLTRTHAARETSISLQRSALRDDNARAIADALAAEIAQALFAYPVDPADPAVQAVVPQAADSNYPRLSPLWNPTRYGADRDVVDNVTRAQPRDGIPDFPYNFAPYRVVPFTNWPDEPFGFMLWPRGPGSPTGRLVLDPPFMAIPMREQNPAGNSGFGDSRWLADVEPLRWDTDNDGFEDAFSHWRHLTNVSRPNNGWRIVAGINDVGDSDGIGEGFLVTNLAVPVEQWLVGIDPLANPLFSTLTGNAIYVPSQFSAAWLGWLGPSYAANYANPPFVPPNFLDLSDLDGDGFPFLLEPGERPEDEFNGPSPTWPAGSPRWDVSRFLADADGDGFTDSFWFFPPSTVEQGIRQVVAVRIVDNSSMVNVDTATRFLRNDLAGTGEPIKTKGKTPADVALVGGLTPWDTVFIDPAQWNVGFFDNPDHWFDDSSGAAFVRYDDNVQVADPNGVTPEKLWERHVNEVGLYFAGLPNLAPNEAARLDYWRRSGRLGLNPDLLSSYTPFGLGEEIELRMYNGNNYPWVYSRLEYATQHSHVFNSGFLHAGVSNNESNEYLNAQLANRDLLREPRHRLTVYNGARNETMPPWLWPLKFPVDIGSDGVIDDGDRFQFEVTTRKFDLRRPIIEQVPPGGVFDIDGDGFTNELYPGVGVGDPFDDDFDENDIVDVRDYLARLRLYLDLALLDGAGGSYIGGQEDKTRRLVASYAANIAAWRDADAIPLTLDRAVEWIDGTGNAHQYIGLERQPFLTEAFVAHVYKSKTIIPVALGVVPPGYTNSGNNLIFAEHPRTTVVVVQIANPFDKPMVLDQPSDPDYPGVFKLRVFSADSTFEADLSGYGTLNPGQSLTLYAMEPQLDGDDHVNPWLQTLALNVPVANSQAVNAWSMDRDDYDGGDENHAIELVRQVEQAPNTGVFENVVVDRIDIKAGRPDEPPSVPKFGVAVNQLANSKPPGFNDAFPNASGAGLPYGIGIDIGSNTHWTQWVHVTRQWDAAGGPVTPDLRNPRFVFADLEVSDGIDMLRYENGFVDGLTPVTKFITKQKDCTTCPPRTYPVQMLQKDADFEQVGELLDVWTFGHELSVSGTYQTAVTFSEFLIDKEFVGDDRWVNRLRVNPDAGNSLGVVLGIGNPNDLRDPLHSVPDLPAAARVFDAFVCDWSGLNPVDVDFDGTIDQADELLARYGNAGEFSGRLTPGLINVNTASAEVMSALPHWARMVHETDLTTGGLPLPVPEPARARVRLPQALVRYRERLGTTISTDINPDYSDRDAVATGLRGERGLASVGEIGLLGEEPASVPFGESNAQRYKDSWKAGFGAENPFLFANPIQSTRISTDVNDVFNVATVLVEPDDVARDAEEANLLFAGASNLLTTRSDVFTVYFKVRSFRQNPITLVWDATDPEYILDDSRYVMLVDRSEVNRPGDKPKVLYMEKLPR